MQSGTFEWKRGHFSSRVRLEISENSIAVEKKSGRVEILYTDIEGVYFYETSLFPLARSISMQVISNSGKDISLSFAAYALFMGEGYATAKKAIAAFLERYHMTVQNADVILGFPRSKKIALYWAVMTAIVLVYTFYSMWREGMMASYIEWLTFAGVALFVSVAMAWSFFRKTGSKRKPALELFEELSSRMTAALTK